MEYFAQSQVPRLLTGRRIGLGPVPLALPKSVKHWSLTTLREKLIKIGAKVVTH